MNRSTLYEIEIFHHLLRNVNKKQIKIYTYIYIYISTYK